MATLRSKQCEVHTKCGVLTFGRQEQVVYSKQKAKPQRQQPVTTIFITPIDHT